MSKLTPFRNNKVAKYTSDSYDDFMLDVQNIHKRFLSVFDEFFDSNWLGKNPNNKYSLASNYNIEQLAENKYKIQINVAGFKKEDIDILLEEDVLTVQGNIKNINKDKYLHQGFAASFYNQFNVAIGSAIDAYLDNGVLEITITEPFTKSKRATKILIK